MSDNNETHGKSQTPFYRIWVNAWQRCYNPKNPKYKNYGERGIQFDIRWLKTDGSMNFVQIDKDMQQSYRDHLIKYPNDTYIDRINNNRDYSFENCRWTTNQDSCKNTTKNKLFVGIDLQTNQFHFHTTQTECAEIHNLERRCIGYCLEGKQQTHAGWKFYYVQDYDFDKKLHLEYDWYGYLMQLAVYQLKCYNFDLVYGPARGGIPLAVHMSHYLNIPMTLDINKLTSNSLIIDDIADSGKTLLDLLESLRGIVSKKPTIATLFMKPRSKIIPDIVIAHTENDIWVRYPWETRDDKPDKDYMVEFDDNELKSAVSEIV